MTIIPLTPPLKCNVNAMTLHLESELSTRLKRNKKKIHPSLKFDIVEACNSWTCHVDELLHKRVLHSQPYFSKYHKSSQTSTSTLQHEPCFGDFELDKVVGCVKPAKDRKHHCKTASGETGRWWRQIDGHWSWRGARRLQKGSRAHCRTTMTMTRLAKSTGPG